jgi:hypothetical protein
MEEEHFYREPSRAVQHISQAELILQIELIVAAAKEYDSYLCSCRKCHRGRRYSVQTIQAHQRDYGRDIHLDHSMVGGDPPDGYPPEGVWIDERGRAAQGPICEEHEGPGHVNAQNLDTEHDIQRQVYDALCEGDRLMTETKQCLEDSDNEESDDDIAERLNLLDELSSRASKSVYTNSSVSIVSATIVLVNMAVIHGVTNAYMDELLKYLSFVLLPSGNSLPDYNRNTRKLIRKLGLTYDVINTCPGGYILYRNEHSDLTSCPKIGCGKSRYMEGSTVIPARVIRFFPFIPRVLRMYRSPAIADLLRYHYDNPNDDNSVMKSVADSLAWKYIDSDVDRSFG